MDVLCDVHIDGSLAAVQAIFAGVPRVGESLAISEYGDIISLQVDRVTHVAKGAMSDDPQRSILIYASRVR
jgi:hypothetical protein